MAKQRNSEAGAERQRRVCWTFMDYICIRGGSYVLLHLQTPHQPLLSWLNAAQCFQVPWKKQKTNKQKTFGIALASSLSFIPQSKSVSKSCQPYLQNRVRI